MTMVKRFLSVQTSVQADEGQEQKFLLFEAAAIKKNKMSKVKEISFAASKMEFSKSWNYCIMPLKRKKTRLKILLM